MDAYHKSVDVLSWFSEDDTGEFTESEVTNIWSDKSPGYIILNDNYGFLCEKKNPKSIIENIKKLISTEKDSLFKKTETTYQHVKDNFDRALILKAYKNTVAVYAPKD